MRFSHFLHSCRKIFVCICSILIAATLQSNGQEPAKTEDVVFYHPNGQIKIKGTKKDGKMQGVSYVYYENGKKRKENHWENDVQIGETICWFENGNIDYKGQIKEGEEDGEWKYYNDLDGKYIYSVFYEKGGIVGYKFSRNKYNWRKIDLADLLITFDFPSHIFDSMTVPGSLSSYWTMFPWRQKSEIEFYSLTVVKGKTEQELAELFKTFDSKSDYAGLFSYNERSDPSIPNIDVDNYTILPAKKRLLKNREVVEVEVIFRDFDISLKTMFIPVQTELYMLSVYYNNKTQNEICQRFLNSIDFKK